LKEFDATSYLDRYEIFCKKLIYERHYSATSLIWANQESEFGFTDNELSFKKFIASFQGYLIGKIEDYK